MIEQRIARRRDQHRVAGRAAEQLEQPGVRLAGARRQHDALRIDAAAAARVVGRDGPAGGRQAERLGLVRQRLRRAERLQQVGG